MILDISWFSHQYLVVEETLANPITEWQIQLWSEFVSAEKRMDIQVWQYNGELWETYVTS